MGINNERLAANVEKIRADQMHRVHLRMGSATPAHVLSEDMLERFAEGIREEEILKVWMHPAYGDMARGFARIGCPTKTDNDIIAHALHDNARQAAGIWALYLHASGGLTPSRLAALWEVSGRNGRARAHAMIAYMRFLGYVEPDDASEDGRERRYRPTERMRGAFQRYFVEQLEIGETLVPAVRETITRMDDPAVFDVFMRVLGEGLIIAALLHRLSRGGPSLDVFSKRRSGMVILWALMLSAPDGEEWPTRETFPIVIADLARRCGVSRTHVQRALREAEAAGMVALEGEGRIRIRGALRMEVNTFTALTLIAMNGAAMYVQESRPELIRPAAS